MHAALKIHLEGLKESPALKIFHVRSRFEFASHDLLHDQFLQYELQRILLGINEVDEES